MLREIIYQNIILYHQKGCKSLSLDDLILLKFIWCMTINKIKVEFKRGTYASILTRIFAYDSPKKAKCWFTINNFKCKKFFEIHVVCDHNEMQVEFVRRSCASICTGVMALSRSENKNIWFLLYNMFE